MTTATGDELHQQHNKRHIRVHVTNNGVHTVQKEDPTCSIAVSACACF
jgi:hypothetical protein